MLELITGPMTGQQYLDSLQDGREVYIYGERVKDVVTHRAFRNAARSIARLYDALHDPKYKDALLATDREGILTHKFFKPSYSAQELGLKNLCVRMPSRSVASSASLYLGSC